VGARQLRFFCQVIDAALDGGSGDFEESSSGFDLAYRYVSHNSVVDSRESEKGNFGEELSTPGRKINWGPL